MYVESLSRKCTDDACHIRHLSHSLKLCVSVCLCRCQYLCPCACACPCICSGCKERVGIPRNWCRNARAGRNMLPTVSRVLARSPFYPISHSALSQTTIPPLACAHASFVVRDRCSVVVRAVQCVYLLRQLEYAAHVCSNLGTCD